MAKKKTASRESCLGCTVKHICQARALCFEVDKGYPDNYFFAMGHLAEAEDESVKEFPRLAAFIRDQRLQWQGDARFVPMWSTMVKLVELEMFKTNKLPRNYPVLFYRRPLCEVGCKDCPAAKRGRTNIQAADAHVLRYRLNKKTNRRL